jgi:hypothetical protein
MWVITAWSCSWKSHRTSSYVISVGWSITVKVMLRLTVSMLRCWALSGTCDQKLLSVQKFLCESSCLVSVGCPLWPEVGSVICHSQSVVIYQYLHQWFFISCVLEFSNSYTIFTKLLSVPTRYSWLCSTSYY